MSFCGESVVCMVFDFFFLKSLWIFVFSQFYSNISLLLLRINKDSFLEGVMSFIVARRAWLAATVAPQHGILSISLDAIHWERKKEEKKKKTRWNREPLRVSNVWKIFWVNARDTNLYCE